MQKNNRKNPFLAAPVLICAAMIGMILLRAVGGSAAEASGQIVTSVLAMAAFGVPIAAFFLLGRQKKNPDRFADALCVRRCSGAERALIVWATAALVALDGFFTHGIFRAGEPHGIFFFSATLDAPTGISTLGAILFLGILPAIAEEAFLRGFLRYEYRFAGRGTALLTGLVSAMLTFSFAQAPAAFFGGVFLTFVVSASGNLLCAISARAIARSLLVIFSPMMARVSGYAESRPILLLLSLAVLCLAVPMLLFAASKTAAARGEREELPPVRVPRGHSARVIADLVSSYFLWADVLIYLVFAILALF